MTREEAWRSAKGYLYDALDGEEADEIIKALEQEPCEDAISRDKAIVQLSHLLSDWDDDWNVAIRKCIETIKIVPPAAPHYTDAEIQKMQEMEQAQLEKAYELGKAEMQPSEDCISRQAVLDGIADLKKSPWFNDDTNGAKFIRKEAVEIIEDLCIKSLPPVTPKTKTGHWINIDATHSQCDRCGAVFEIVSANGEANYCPNCRAKMQEVER